MRDPIPRCPICGKLQSQESSNPCRCKDKKKNTSPRGISGPAFIRWLFIIGISITVVYFTILLSAVFFPKLHAFFFH